VPSWSVQLHTELLPVRCAAWDIKLLMYCWIGTHSTPLFVISVWL